MDTNTTTTDERQRMKPDCPLTGQDGNIFNLMGVASRTLRNNGLDDAAKEMCERIRGSGNYYKAIGIIGEYVNIRRVYCRGARRPALGRGRVQGRW